MSSRFPIGVPTRYRQPAVFTASPPVSAVAATPAAVGAAVSARSPDRLENLPPFLPLMFLSLPRAPGPASPRDTIERSQPVEPELGAISGRYFGAIAALIRPPVRPSVGRNVFAAL